VQIVGLKCLTLLPLDTTFYFKCQSHVKLWPIYESTVQKGQVDWFYFSPQFPLKLPCNFEKIPFFFFLLFFVFEVSSWLFQETRRKWLVGFCIYTEVFLILFFLISFSFLKFNKNVRYMSWKLILSHFFLLIFIQLVLFF